MFKVDRFYSRVGGQLRPMRLFEPAKIALSAGAPDPKTLPVEEIKRVLAEASHENWHEMLQYSNMRGSPSLRSELARFMWDVGVKCDADREVLVTTGSQQTFYLMSRLFVEAGDAVLVEAPAYSQALYAFRQFEPELRSIPVDEDGLDPEALEAELRRLTSEGKRPKFLYTNPSFQNPSTTLMTRERRLRVLELAEEFDFLILEDDPYGYLSFEGPMPTPMKAFDGSGRVVFASSLSKILSTGLRVGWVVAGEEVATKMTVAKWTLDIATDGVGQHVAAELLRRGVVGRQIPRVTELYRRKRDAMLEAMEAHFPSGVMWSRPKGGMFVWVRLPEGVDASKIRDEAASRGVSFSPGSGSFLDPSITNYMRPGFSYASEEDIREGVKVLGEVLRRYV